MLSVFVIFVLVRLVWRPSSVFFAVLSIFGGELLRLAACGWLVSIGVFFASIWALLERFFTNIAKKSLFVRSVFLCVVLSFLGFVADFFCVCLLVFLSLFFSFL